MRVGKISRPSSGYSEVRVIHAPWPDIHVRTLHGGWQPGRSPRAPKPPLHPCHRLNFSSAAVAVWAAEWREVSCESGNGNNNKNLLRANDLSVARPLLLLQDANDEAWPRPLQGGRHSIQLQRVLARVWNTNLVEKCHLCFAAFAPNSSLGPRDTRS